MWIKILTDECVHKDIRGFGLIELVKQTLFLSVGVLLPCH